MSAGLNLPEGTLLVLTPLSGALAPVLTPWSARGLTQTLELIGNRAPDQLRRDVNGFLRDVTDFRFRKFRSTISCRDGETPCLDDAWIGQTVQVSCALELNYQNGGTPARTVVSGSERTQGDFIYYRPLLTMLVASIENGFQEYPALNGWSMTLEEF